VLLKNCLYPNNFIESVNRKRRHFLPLLLFFSFNSKSQILANYVSNGGFEDHWSCSFPNDINKVKSWRSIDSTYTSISNFYSACPGLSIVPYSPQGFQFARSGNSYAGFVVYCLNGGCNNNINRSYARNRLKATLQSGKTYCLKFYCNVTNYSTCGVDGIGAFFCDNNTLDTITKQNIPLTYLNPQIQNANGNVLTDTLNWIPVSGTFVATGSEKNLLIGNFKSNASTNTLATGPTTITESDMYIDDVSCIDIDLPAYAGPDLYALPGNTVYIGRPRDVGIDDACTWYKLPNIATPIYTAAGITVTVGVQTNTYVVKQDICGNIKYDTVVVYTSAVGLAELKMKSEFKIVPNPAQDYILIKGEKGEPINISISDASGRILQKEKVLITDTEGKLNLTLQNGIYFVTLTNSQKQSVVQKLIISK
jgi:hypothetical protein